MAVEHMVVVLQLAATGWQSLGKPVAVYHKAAAQMECMIEELVLVGTVVPVDVAAGHSQAVEGMCPRMDMGYSFLTSMLVDDMVVRNNDCEREVRA